jgi:hypothetical protein
MTLLGWQPFFDGSITINTDLQKSDTGEYYQEKHPALRLDYIKATLSAGMDINAYLTQKMQSGINGMLNDVLQYRKVAKYGKTLLEQAQLLNRLSWKGDRIMNQGRFVGFQISVRDVTALQLVINEVGLQLSGSDTVKLYLFHSQVEDPLMTMDITTTDTSTKWMVPTTPAPVEGDPPIPAEWNLNAISPEKYHGGVFILGYYQDDLSTQAINYPDFNWTAGECGGCNNSYYGVWTSIRQHFFVFPLYVPAGNFTVGKMFDLEKASFSNTESWGLNLKFSVRCDLTDFFNQNRFVFKNLLAYKVAHLILNDMKFTQETSYIEENLKHMIIRDLEGDKETNALNISQQYQRELKAVSFDMSGINNRCLDCEDTTFVPTIGVM